MRFLVLLLPLLTMASARADNAALDAWLRRQASIASLEAEFIQERKLPALKNPVTTQGRLSFAKPDKIRWQLGEPLETLAVSDGATLTLIDAATKIACQTDVDSPQALRFSLLSGKVFQSQEGFQQAFEIVEMRITLGICQYTLKAKDRRLRTQIPWVFLDIDPQKNELRAIEFELQDKSRLRSVFSNVRFNLKLDEKLFKPDLSGYEVK